MRIIALLVLAFALGGCLLPPALSIASFAADGVSLAATGKSINDHALSEVLDQDCALWRIVKDEEICVDYVLEEGDTVMVAEGEGEPAAVSTTEIAALSVPEPATAPTIRTVSLSTAPGMEASSLLMRFGAPSAPPRANMAGAVIRPAFGSFDMAEIEAATYEKAGMTPALVASAIVPITTKERKIFHGPVIQPATFSPALPLSIGPIKLAEAEPYVEETFPEPPQIEVVSWTPVKEDLDVYLILGSYPAADMAVTAAGGMETDVQLSVLPALVKGKTYFRVVAGPFTMDHARLEKTNMVAAGIDDAWLTRL